MPFTGACPKRAEKTYFLVFTSKCLICVIYMMPSQKDLKYDILSCKTTKICHLYDAFLKRAKMCQVFGKYTKGPNYAIYII